MLPRSQTYIQAVTQLNRMWYVSLSVLLDSGESLVLTADNIVLGSFVFKEASTCSNTLQVGSTYANSLEFSILNTNNAYAAYDFSNARVVADVGIIPAGQSTPIVQRLGTFNVVSCGKKRATIPLQCLDDMYRTNVALPESYVAYPTSLYALVNDICTYCSVNISSTLTQELLDFSSDSSYLGVEYTVSIFDHSQYTCRDILSFVGIILGKNLRFSRDGFLESFWYTDYTSAFETTPDTRVKTSEYEDNLVQVTGVQITDAFNNTIVEGTDQYIIKFDPNPVITSSELLPTIAQMLLNKLSALQYQPCTIYFMGDPACQAGDIISHVQLDSSVFVAPIMQHIFKLGGTTTFEAVGETAQQNRQLTRSAKALQHARAQMQYDLNQGLSTIQKIVLAQSDLITSALGFYPKVVYNDDGSIQGYYLLSTPEDSDSTTVWAITSNGIGLSHTGMAGPYTSSWTVNDSIVASIISADMLRTGVIQSTDEHRSFYLDLNTGKLEMNAEYLAIRGRSISDVLEISEEDGQLVVRLGSPQSGVILKQKADRIAFCDTAGAELAYWTTTSLELQEIQQIRLGPMSMITRKNKSVSFVKAVD